MAVDSAGFRKFATQMGLPRSATEELISQVEGIDEKIAALKAEVARLREENERLREMLEMFATMGRPTTDAQWSTVETMQRVAKRKHLSEQQRGQTRNDREWNESHAECDRYRKALEREKSLHDAHHFVGTENCVCSDTDKDCNQARRIEEVLNADK